MSTALPQIASRAWEHPTDRAALATLRAIPGLDEVVETIASTLTDVGLRRLILGDAVQVSATQHGELHGLLTEVCATLDCPTRPDLYVAPSSCAFIYGIGFDRPFIVFSSTALEQLAGADEQRFLLAHEVGHIMSGHMRYRTVAVILMATGGALLPSLLGVALLPFVLALMEWHRKSELSSDRAGLLGTQDAPAAYRAFMRLGRRGAGMDSMSGEEYVAQAMAHPEASDDWQRLASFMSEALRLAPEYPMRARELEHWRTSGQYDAIIAGAYARRGAPEQGLRDDYRDAARSYTKGERVMWRMSDAVTRATDAFRDAFDGRSANGGAAASEPPGRG